MTDMDSAVYFNIHYYLTFGLSLCFNCILIYFIRHNPSHKLKNYSLVLIQGVILDFLTSFGYVAVQIYFECTHGYLFYQSTAPWMYIFEPYVKNKWSIPVLTFCVLSQFSNPIQGLYRYLHFRLHITLRPLHIFGIYSACCACVTAVGILHVLSYEPINDVPKAIEIITEMPYWREHSDKLSGFYVGSLLSVYMIFSVIALLILINIGAGCLLFFNHQVNSYLKTLKVHMASKTIQLQKQIARQLMLQFCLPGMIGGIGIVSASCLMFLPEYSGGVVMLMFCPFQWVPVLNPIITIMCIADYRRQLLRLLKGKNTTVGSTIVVPTATGHVDSKNQQGSGTVHIQF